MPAFKPRRVNTIISLSTHSNIDPDPDLFSTRMDGTTKFSSLLNGPVSDSASPHFLC